MGHFEAWEREGKGKEGNGRKGREEAPPIYFWLRPCLMRITTAKADNDCLKLHNSRRIVCISNSRSSSSSSRKKCCYLGRFSQFVACSASAVGLDRISHIVQRRRLNDDAEGADEAGGREHPQKHPVQNHRHELPVLLHLCTPQSLRILTRRAVNDEKNNC